MGTWRGDAFPVCLTPESVWVGDTDNVGHGVLLHEASKSWEGQRNLECETVGGNVEIDGIFPEAANMPGAVWSMRAPGGRTEPHFDHMQHLHQNTVQGDDKEVGSAWPMPRGVTKHICLDSELWF